MKILAFITKHWKPILIGVAFIVIIILGETIKHYRTLYKYEKAEKERLKENQRQYLNDSLRIVRLEMKLDEFVATINPKVEDILKESKIKAKNVTSVVERHFVYRDTSYKSYKPQPVQTPKGIVYPFTDIKDCFTVKGFVVMDSLRPVIAITDRKFENNTIDIAYVKRAKKFLGIPYGKWKGQLKSKGDCGSEKIKSIEIIKDK
jgi:hypothetical protein